MNRNRLKGREGDAVNVLAGAAMNFGKLLRALAPLLPLFLTWHRATQWQLRARTGLRALEGVLLAG